MKQLSTLRDRACGLRNWSPSHSSMGGPRPSPSVTPPSPSCNCKSTRAASSCGGSSHHTRNDRRSLSSKPPTPALPSPATAPTPLMPKQAAATPVSRNGYRTQPRSAVVPAATSAAGGDGGASGSGNDMSYSAVPLPPDTAPRTPAAEARDASSAAAAAAAAASKAAISEAGQSSAGFEFVCPICLTTQFRIDAMPSKPGGLSCGRCARTFPASPAYLDLTATAGSRQRVYKQRAWGGTELFRSPLVSFAYERGWRQSFAWAGFPGADAEYELAMSYLVPAAAGRVLVDMSCGSGLFSRRFARSGRFSGVVAADFSESMLQQTREYCAAEAGSGGGGGSSSSPTPIMLLRADVGRLPFATGSVAALHAGAALHCWPNPQGALAEISRVLAPGGVFVASTFLNAAAPLGALLGDDTVRPLSQLDPTTAFGAARTPYRWWEEAELRELCEGVGLRGFRRERSWRFILFAATKPTPAEA